MTHDPDNIPPAKNGDAPITVAALYRFTRFDDPAALREALLGRCKALGIKGTLLVAHEGLNGTIAGAPDAIDEMIATLRDLPGCAALDVKYSQAPEMPFLRMKVRVKREIVTMGVEDIDAAHDRGDYVDPADWNALIARPDTVVIDTRNQYEVAIGSFAGAVDPGTESFRDFPAWFDAQAEALRESGKTIAMFCTGGIRCEKATAYVKAQGFDQVYHLQGGILRYLETVPETENRFEGDCFVFDQRVSVGHGLAVGEHDLCHACRMPLSPQDLCHPEYEAGVSCHHCRSARDDERRVRYRERQAQMERAAQLGVPHLGAKTGGD